MKLFRCEFEIDTGVSFKKPIAHVFANVETDCLDILRNSKEICTCNEDSNINLIIK